MHNRVEGAGHMCIVLPEAEMEGSLRKKINPAADRAELQWLQPERIGLCRRPASRCAEQQEEKKVQDLHLHKCTQKKMIRMLSKNNQLPFHHLRHIRFLQRSRIKKRQEKFPAAFIL